MNRRRVTSSTPATQHCNPTINPKILKVLWELKKNGKADLTIKNVSKCLIVLDDKCNLDNPEEVKAVIATLDRKNGYKRQLCYSYNNYVKIHGLIWNKPVYYATSKLPKIPQERQIDSIIANASKKLATAIAISRDTGLRPIELMNVRLRDVDLSKGAIYPETAKHGSPRVLKLKKSTLNMLNKYLTQRHVENNDNLFGTWTSETYSKLFRHARNKTAEKLADPSIKTVRLYDLRHFFATMTYHRTKDILFVKQQMGHKKIETTLVYTQLLQFEQDDNYTCRVATNTKEDTELIEAGFEYVTERDGLKIYRKRK